MNVLVPRKNSDVPHFAASLDFKLGLVYNCIMNSLSNIVASEPKREEEKFRSQERM